MNIISVDVGWKETTRRNAVAIAKPGRQIYFVAGGLGDSDLINLIRERAEFKSLVLLDVPIEGCQNLNQPRRLVESALQHYISLYPASIAGKTYTRWKKTEMPEDIRVESISDYQIAELNRLKDWLYRKRTQARLDRERAERRRTKEEEAARKKAEQPALFEF